MENTTTTLHDQVLTHMNRAITYSYTISNGQDRYEDLYQEAIYRILRTNQHNPEPKVDAGYMNQTVKRIAIDNWKVDKRVAFNVDITEDNLARSYRIEKECEDRDTLRGIQKQVSEDAWRVINLVSDGYTVSEISEMMEISDRKVRYHIERVRLIAKR